MLIIFFDVRGIVHKEFVMAGQIVNSAYYCDVYNDCMKMCKDFAPSHSSFFTGKFLTKNNTTVIPHPPYFSLFSQLKMKLEGRQFDTIEVIEAESRVMLNTLTEHNFQDAFYKWQNYWEWCIRVEWGYIKGYGGQ
jgi:hypothetical protein